MFGVLFGAVCLIGLVFMLSRGGWHGHRRGRRGLYRLLSRLDTTPAQEKVIRDELALLRERAHDFHDKTRAARKELAQTVDRDEFDRDGVAAWFEARERELATVKEQLIDSMRTLHGVLDTRQRRALVALLETEPALWRDRGRDCRAG